MKDSIASVTSKQRCYIILFLVFLCMVVLNFLTPLIADDLEYLYKTESFFTIIKDEYLQYMTWTGRSVVHIIARLFLLMPKAVFNIFNALAFVFVGFSIYSLTKMDDKDHPWKLIMVFCLLWLFVPTFGQVFLWETGACNYLWGMLLVIIYLRLNHISVYHHENKFNRLPEWSQYVIFLISGLLAGWSNENTSGGALLISGYYLLINYNNNKKINFKQLVGIVGNIIGLAFMVLAPGNKIRAGYFGRNEWTLFKKITNGIVEITRALTDNAMWIFILFILLFVLAVYTKIPKERINLAIVYFLSGLATIFVLAVSPTGQTWSRSFFGGVVFFILAILFVWPNSVKKNCSKSLVYVIISAIIGSFFFMSFVNGCFDIYLSKRDFDERYDYLISQRNSGNLNPVFPKVEGNYRSNYPAYSDRLSHINTDVKSQVNRSNAQYFGLDSVVEVPVWEWQEIYKNGDSKLMGIVDPIEYLKTLANSKYLVTIAGYGSDYGYDDVFNQALKEVVPNVELPQNETPWWIAHTNSGEAKRLTQGNYSEESLSLNAKTIDVKASYTEYEEQRFGKIFINDFQASKNQEGLNMVIFDMTGNILDSVHFTTDKDGKVYLVR